MAEESCNITCFWKYDHALTQDPCPGGYETYDFDRPFVGYHYNILTLSDKGVGVEKKTF